MASIKIDNLQTAGFDLFNDVENYLTELNKQELNSIIGGVISGSCIPTMTILTFTNPIVTIVQF